MNAAAACPAGQQRALFQLWVGHPVVDADLDALLSREAESKLAWKFLDATQPNQRAAIVKIIAADADGTSELIDNLAKAEGPLESELLEALAKRFVRRNGLLQISDRHQVLELFAKAAAEPARVKSARAVISSAIATEKDSKHKAMLEAVLVTLGDSSRVRAALPCIEDPIYGGDYPSLDADVCAWALIKHGGCTVTGKVLSCP